MIITCEECGTAFNLNESLLKASGSKVQCSKCKNIFVAYPLAKEPDADEPTETVAGDKGREYAQAFQPQKENEDPATSTEEMELVEEKAEPELESLELDLDIEESETGKDFTETEPRVEIAADDLDLSDMEALLETDKELIKGEAGSGDKNEADLDDLELELDMELDTDENIATSESLLENEKSEPEEYDLDLSDLDAMFDEDPAYKKTETGTGDIEDLELELDIGLDTDENTATSESLLENEKSEPEEYDLDAIFDEEPPYEKTETGTGDIEDLKLELDHEPDAEEFSDNVQGPQETEFSETSLEDKPDSDEFYDELTTEETEEAPEEAVDIQIHEDKPGLDKWEKFEETDADMEEEFSFENQTESGEKKKTSALVLVFLITALLAGSAYGAFIFIKPVNAFIKDLFKTEAQKDAGDITISLIQESVNGKFVENTQVGRLFVITGRVKNVSDQLARSARIKGNLFTKGGVLAQTKTVYCGNELSDTELSNLDPADIDKRLLNPDDDNKINVDIKPGNDIPFMVVFANLPDDLVNFTVEVAESSKK